METFITIMEPIMEITQKPNAESTASGRMERIQLPARTMASSSFSMAVAMIFGMLFGQIVKMMTPAA